MTKTILRNINFRKKKKIAAKISPVPVECKHISNDAITAS